MYMNYMDVMVNKYGKELAMELIEELLDWRDIEDYEGLYRVSEWGDVMSLKGGEKRLLSKKHGANGYLFVTLCRNGKEKTAYIHRLVATAFCEGAGDFEQVNHRDEDKTNNHHENLEWCTPEYNVNYGTHNQRVSRAVTKTMTEKYGVRVRCIELDMEFNSVKEAEIYTGAYAQNITACCRGRYKTTGGYHWEYVD